MERTDALRNLLLVECAAALTDLKLLVGSGGLDFTKGMDSLDKHVEQISFSASHFANMGS